MRSMAAQRTENILHDLGQRIQKLRQAKGYTQETLAGRLRMLTPNYARIEQGRSNVTIDTLVRIANALSIEVKELLEPPVGPRSRPGRPRTTG